VNDSAVKWTEGPLLPWLPPPPPDRIMVRGAKYVRIYSTPGSRKIDGGREAVILAWARCADGGWGVLLAWAGWCTSSLNKGTAHARWGWCRYEEQQVCPLVPVRSHNPGIEYAWYGQPEPNELLSLNA
jgi:hypothetical protein